MDESDSARGQSLSEPDDSGSRAVWGAESARRRLRLLLVEDDPATRDELCRLFLRRGFEVLWSPTVEGGLALLQADPDWVILDLILPDGDGERVLAKIRAAGLPVRVIVTSATTDERRLARVALMKPELLLRKPVDLDEMVRPLGDVARGS
jgi:DNA-binding response OmpR family regulator